MPIGPARMPLMDHLGELRRRLMIIVVCLLVSACVLYVISPQIIEFLTLPIQEFIPDKLVVLNAFGGFTLKFLVALFAAAVVCSPIIF